MKKKGESVFRGEEQTTTATAARDAAFQIEGDNVNAAGRLKIEDGRGHRGNRREFSRFALIRGDVDRARSTKKCISIGYAMRRVSSPRDSSLECDFRKVNSRRYSRYGDIKMETCKINFSYFG